MSPEKHLRQVRYPLGVVGFVLAAFLLRVGVGRVINSSVNSGYPTWLPMTGSTLGETIVMYNLLVNGFTLIVVPAVAFWLGREYGRSAR